MKGGGRRSSLGSGDNRQTMGSANLDRTMGVGEGCFLVFSVDVGIAHCSYLASGFTCQYFLACLRQDDYSALRPMLPSCSTPPLAAIGLARNYCRLFMVSCAACYADGGGGAREYCNRRRWS
jgi:hypothetical protein